MSALRVEMLPAGHGDALWVEWDDSQGSHRVLIDGGPGRTYPLLRQRIDRLPAGDRRLDLLTITHIDTDHIDGAITLLLDELNLELGDIWFNGRNHLARPLSPVAGNRYLGGVEGQVLSAILDQPGLPWNEAFAGRAVVVPPRSFPAIPIGDLTLTLLSPGASQLQRLARSWTTDVGRALANLELVEKGASEEKIAHKIRDGGLDTARRLLEHRFKKRLQPPAGWLQASEEGRFLGDASRPNGSSIAFLLEDETRATTVLFAADAHAKVLLDSIRRLLIERRQSRLRLDAFKVSHHGSKHNVSAKLLAKLDCQAFLFSSDGSHGHDHPHDETVELILAEARSRDRRPRLYFNYLSDRTEPWSREARGNGRDYEAFYPPAGRGDHGLTVELPAA